MEREDLWNKTKHTVLLLSFPCTVELCAVFEPELMCIYVLFKCLFALHAL